MYSEISLLVDKLEENRCEAVLLVGDFMLDEYLYGDTNRISPEAPIPVLKVINRESRLGGAASVGACLAGLGAKTFCVGALGDDEAGKTIVDMLEKSGADASGMVRTNEIKTTVKQRMIGLAEHKNRQQLLRIDMEDDGVYSSDIIAKLKKQIEPMLDKVKLIAIEDYNKGAFGSGELLDWLVPAAKSKGISVVVDPARVSDYSRYRGVSVITPNRPETSVASGVEVKTIDDAKRAGDLLREKFDIGAIVSKLDREGMVVVSDEGSKAIANQPREVFDGTGAGDVVLSCLAVGLAEGMSLTQAATLANIGGGWEVEQAGVVPITREILMFEVLKQSRRHMGKLMERSVLLREVELLRRAGKKIVFTNGCFDLLHPGHVSYLEFSKEQGDILVVGTNSDKSIQKIKGPSRPFIGEKERARMLGALAAVDYVVIFDEPSVLGLVKEVRPDVLVKGSDYSVDGVVGNEFVTSYGGEIALAPIEHEYSTSKIVETIVERSKA